MASLQNPMVKRGRSLRAPLLALQLSLVAILVTVLTACDNSTAKNGPPPPPGVSVADVVVKKINQWDDFNGRIEAVQSVQLRPRVSGYIDKVNYTEGRNI